MQTQTIEYTLLDERNGVKLLEIGTGCYQLEYQDLQWAHVQIYFEWPLAQANFEYRAGSSDEIHG